MNEERRRWQAQNGVPRSVLPPPDEIPAQMSPFSNDRWDLDQAENIRRKEIQRSYVYNGRYFEQLSRAPEETTLAKPSQEHVTTVTPNQEPEDIPQVSLNPLPDVSNVDYFKTELPSALKPKSIDEISFETPAPPNLYPVLKFPEKRIKPDAVYHLPTKESFVPRPSGLPPGEPPPLERPPLPQFYVYKDYQPEKPKPMHYGIQVPLWKFSSYERHPTKRSKVIRTPEPKINKRNSNDGGSTSTKGDISKPVSTESSHEDLAKVLKTLGGISKSLGYKIPKENSAKSFRGKKKASELKESEDNRPMPALDGKSRAFTTDSSQSLTQKVAEVLTCVTGNKPLSELNLSKIGANLTSFKNGNVSVPNFPFVGKTNTLPSVDFSVYENTKMPTYLTSNKSSIGEKSRSSEYFKYFNLMKQPSKSLSYERDQSLKAERQDLKLKGFHSISQNTSETLIRKVDLTKSQNSSHFRQSPPLLTDSFESTDWGKLGFCEPDAVSVYSYPNSNATQSRICPHRSHSGSAKLNLNAGIPSCFSSLLPAISSNGKFCSCDVKKPKCESLNKESENPLTSVDPTGNDSKEPSKISVKVCHCPHLHTENTIKKICFHNCLSPQNFYSSKIFRLNYLPKDDQPKDEQSSERNNIKRDEEPVTEGPKTDNLQVLEKIKSSTKTISKVLSSDLVNRDRKKSNLSLKMSEPNKVISKVSLKTRKSISSSKTEKKEKLKKARTFPDYTRPNILLWNKENHVRILGQSNPNGKRRTNEKKSSEGTPKHDSKQMVESKRSKMGPQVKESTRRVVRPLSRLRSRDSKKVSNDEKALEELTVLEKLFGKLNTVERSLRNQKLADGHRSFPKMTLKRNKGEDESRLSFNQMKSLLMLDSPTEEECQRRRRKLRSAIIRHVQNWLKLDFDEF